MSVALAACPCWPGELVCARTRHAPVSAAASAIVAVKIVVRFGILEILRLLNSTSGVYEFVARLFRSI
jgi:hypothetical protein